jgi:hypothetical protein
VKEERLLENVWPSSPSRNTGDLITGRHNKPVRYEDFTEVTIKNALPKHE